MRIGVDIDGVLTDIEKFEIECGGKYFYDLDKPIINPNGYGSYEIFKPTEEQDNIYWKDAIYEYIKEPARRFAGEVLRKLLRKGHEVYIITNRISDLSYSDIKPKHMKNIVIDWLKENSIPYTKLIFSDKNKEKEIVENNIDIMIEDKPKNIEKLSKITKVFCYDAKYNETIVGKNIIRCYSWYDILYKIEHI